MKNTSRIFLIIAFLFGTILILYTSCGNNSTEPAPCYSITIETNGSGTVDIQPDSGCYHSGTNVTLTATADAGWNFDNWSGDITGEDNPLIVTISDTDISVTADFSEAEYTLIIDINPANSGSVTVNPDQDVYGYNDTISLTAQPDSGYYFESWSGDTTSNENPLGLIILSNTSVTANFEVQNGPESDTVSISGTVTWPEHDLSEYTYAFADTAGGQYVYLLAQTDVNPDDGSYTLIIPDVTDSLQLYIEAQDDVNNSQPWIPDAGDGWGFFDVNQNGQWDTNDYITVYPGDNITGIDIILDLYQGLRTAVKLKR